MKFINLLSACAITLAMGACNNQPAETAPAPAPVVIEKEVVKEEPLKKKEEIKKEVVSEKKTTTVKFGPNGGSLKTDKVDIEINH